MFLIRIGLTHRQYVHVQAGRLPTVLFCCLQPTLNLVSFFTFSCLVTALLCLVNRPKRLIGLLPGFIDRNVSSALFSMLKESIFSLPNYFSIRENIKPLKIVGRFQQPTSPTCTLLFRPGCAIEDLCLILPPSKHHRTVQKIHAPIFHEICIIALQAKFYHASANPRKNIKTLKT